MILIFRSFICLTVLAGTFLAAATSPSPRTGLPSLQQRSEVDLIIGDRIGAQPTFAVPDCLTSQGGAEIAQAGLTIAAVLWDDLNFEREFRMLARDTYASIPPARSLTALPLDDWRELGADGVISCSVASAADGQITVTARLFNTRSLESAFGVEYTGPLANVRVYAHQLSDEIHRNQRGLVGVARTKISFVSDRDSESVLGLVENRQTKEVYFSDYDGANPQRVTVSRSLNTTPQWAPNARAIAYTSWRRGFQDVFVSHIYEGRLESPAGGTVEIHNWLPAWSPDGRQMALTSNRDGNPELYVINVDGSNVRRLTNHPGIDTTPTWSPQGHQIAFTSDRTGSPQIYVIDVDGTGLRRISFESYCDRPTWSPAPYNEIAYSSRTSPGHHDIKIIDLATSEVRQVTFGIGTNESPSYSPNGRHIAFMSTRGSGDKNIWVIGRDGRGLRRLTSTGNNEMPSWSP
jgi:TolB protein